MIKQNMMRPIFLKAGLSLTAMIFASAHAIAQDTDESALDALDNAPKPVVARVEPAGSVELRDAIRRIAQRPTDAYALTDAGYASLKLGDADAAYNFLIKAAALQPADSRIKAGLGAAQVRRENPFEALRLFDEAIKMGANERSIAFERALAYDLLGNFERAQQDYQLARTYQNNDEIAIRQAMSLSLAGRSADADAMLGPLIQKNMSEAWRARAFMLAARGNNNEASRITAGFLTPLEAQRLDGYLRQMPRLTAAQQAAALHFGHFPVGSNIGKDTPEIAKIAAANPRPPKGDERLVPTGQPLGGKTDGKPKKLSSAERRAQKEAEKAAKNAAKNPVKTGVTTASAQEAIERAARAKPAIITSKALPEPEAARPAVKIALPFPPAPPPVIKAAVEPPKPVVPSPAISVPASVKTEPATAAELPAIKTAPIQTATTVQTAAAAQNTPIVQTPTVIGTSVPPGPVATSNPVTAPVIAETDTKIVPVKVASTDPVETPTPKTNEPTPAMVSLDEKPVSVAPAPAANIETAAIKTAEAGNIAPDVPVKIAEAKPVMDTPPVKQINIPAEPQAAKPAIASLPTSANLPQGPQPDGSVVTQSAPAIGGVQPATAAPVIPEPVAPKPDVTAPSIDVASVQTPPVIVEETPKVIEPTPFEATPVETPTVAEVPVVAETPVEAPAPAFDLGNIVESIEIPESEQKRDVVPVDLKSIKAKPKTDAALNDGKDVKGKVDPKKSTSLSRIWVQVATGSDISGLAYDYRRLAKKYGILFNNVSGWTAEWGRSRRLLVGPFADMKAAKKWEADYRKGGGDGFIWQSEKGAEVDPIKAK